MKQKNKNFMTLDELKAKSEGRQATAASPAPITFVQNPEACGIKPNPAPTPASVGLDTSKLIGQACGYFEIKVNLSSTAISANLLWLVGGNSRSDNEGQIRELYPAIPTGIETVFDTAAAVDSVPGSATTFANFGLTSYMNYLFANDPILISSISFTNDGGAAGTFTTVKATSWLSRGLVI